MLSLLSRLEVSKPGRLSLNFDKEKPAESDRYSLPARKASAKPLQSLKYVIESTAPNYDRQRGVLFHQQHLSNLISVYVRHDEVDHYRVNLMLACESSSGDSVS